MINIKKINIGFVILIVVSLCGCICIKKESGITDKENRIEEGWKESVIGMVPDGIWREGIPGSYMTEFFGEPVSSEWDFKKSPYDVDVENGNGLLIYKDFEIKVFHSGIRIADLFLELTGTGPGAVLPDGTGYGSSREDILETYGTPVDESPERLIFEVPLNEESTTVQEYLFEFTDNQVNQFKVILRFL